MDKAISQFDLASRQQKIAYGDDITGAKRYNGFKVFSLGII